MSITTKEGDDGFTDFIGSNGNIGRVRKDHPIIEVLGSLDELDANLALCEIALQSDGNGHFSGLIKKARKELFISDSHLNTNWLEQQILELEKENPIQDFVRTWTNITAATINAARTICRRCERAMIYAEASSSAETGKNLKITVPSSLHWLNRLSDLLFLLAVSAERTAVKKITQIHSDHQPI